MRVPCPDKDCSFVFTYARGEVEALRQESQKDIEKISGYTMRSVIEYPLREHMLNAHPLHTVRVFARERWML